MTSNTVAAAAPRTETTATPALDAGTRLSDWLNPILVREIQQALNGRVFLITLALSLLAVIVIALLAATIYRPDREIGEFVFVATMEAMIPILVFVVPFQAFLSMRQEVSGGTAELLMLTNLTPRRIVAGKVAASMVHFVVYFGVFAPLLALTFLLRGVDVPMILVGLASAVLACLVATAMAVMLGSLCRWRMVTPFVWGMATLAMAGATALCMGVGGYFLSHMSRWMRETWFWQGLGGWALAMGYALFLFICIGRAMLTHPNENRSTSFRVWALLLAPIGLCYAFLVAERNDLWEGLALVAATALAAVVAVGLFAVTEDDRMSPRTRTLVPANRKLALLQAAFLPGGSRGFLFVLLATSVILLCWLLSVGGLWLVGFAHTRRWPVLVLAYTGLYCVFYMGLARALRARLRPGSQNTWVARCVMPVVFLFCILLPMLVDALANEGNLHEDSIVHILNPFFMIDRPDRDAETKLTLLAILAGFVVALRARDLKRGIHEVLAASAARRTPERADAA